LKPEEEAMLKNMLWEERSAFSQDAEDIGCVPELTLKLRTTDEIPVQRHYNAIPKPLYGEVRAHIQHMLDKGWIVKSSSSWASPIVLAKKKSGGFRLCCDYRQLNQKTIKDKHPLPRIQEAVDSLEGSSWFSKLDFSRAYYQGFMEEESREKTAFVTPWGFYQWVRIPFGLSNAVPTFQRYMESLLEEYRNTCAIPYLDDTLLYSKSVMEHIADLRRILQKFQSKGLKLNLTKCELFKREVSYLGRLVGRDGYKMDEKNVRAVRELANKEFQTVGEVRQLLGLLSFHRRSVQDFAPIAKPLTDLLGGVPEGKKSATGKKVLPSKQKIQWEAEHQTALEKLIQLITNPPLLAYPDYTQPFFIHTDASGLGLGSILYQKQGGEIRVIAYGSRTLKPSERNYHSTKLEFLAMKWAITEQFRDILSYADHFEVFTDNNPLLFIMKLSKPNTTIQRWISELAEFTFSVHYRPGVVNRDADCLSRLPLDIAQYTDLCKESTSLDTFQAMVAAVESCEWPGLPEIKVCASELTKVENLETIADMLRDQEIDPYISPVLVIMKSKPETKPTELPELSKLLLRERKNLFFNDQEILCRRAAWGDQIVLPLKHREMIFKTLHTDMGHLGADRVMQLARQRVYWPKMQSDIEIFTQQRCRCVAQRKSRREAVAPLISIYSSYPMELVAIDYLHLEKSSTGCEYILLIVDHFSRYAQAYATKNKSALTAAKCLFNDFILRFGIPNRILHDQGREFENRLFRELERFCGLVKSRTTPYHPQTNGLCERMNSTLLQMLRSLSESEKPNWHQHLNKLLAAYNATTHSSTGFSPFYILYGREPLLPLDVILGNGSEKKQHPQSYNNFVTEWEERMREAYQVASENIKKVKESSEERWRKRITASTLKPNDKVLVKNVREKGGPGKLRAHWEQEVYVVVDSKPGGVVYEVKSSSGEKRVLHRNMLLPCELLEFETHNSTQKSSTPATRPTRTGAVTRNKSTRQPPLNNSDNSDSSDNSDEDDIQMYQANTTNGCAETQDSIDHIEDDISVDNETIVSRTEDTDEDGGNADEELLTEVHGAMYPFDDLANEYFGSSDEDTETFAGFTDEDDSADNEEAAGTHQEEGLSDEEADADNSSNDDARDAESDREESCAGNSEESSLLSKRVSKPPSRLNYFKLGGDPMVLDEKVTVEDEEETVGAEAIDHWELVQLPVTLPITLEEADKPRWAKMVTAVNSLGRKLLK
jgi:transposase InsO family protein